MSMNESPLTDKISPDMRSNVVEYTIVSYSIDSDKTWVREKFQDCLSSHIVETILVIPIPRTEVSDKII